MLKIYGFDLLDFQSMTRKTLRADVGIMTSTELENLSIELSYIAKSLRYVKDICERASTGNVSPVLSLRISERILQNEIDDLNEIVKWLNQHVKDQLSNSDRAASFLC